MYASFVGIHLYLKEVYLDNQHICLDVATVWTEIPHLKEELYEDSTVSGYTRLCSGAFHHNSFLYKLYYD